MTHNQKKKLKKKNEKWQNDRINVLVDKDLKWLL